MSQEIPENSLPQQTIYVFIDVSNMREVQRLKKAVFDYAKLKSFLMQKFKTRLIKIFYYAAYPTKGTRDYDVGRIHRFYTYLKKELGFQIIKKKLKKILVKIDGVDSIVEKGNMDVEIAIDMVHELENYDMAMLFSGDSDFLALVSFLRNKGKKVYIFSSEANVSQELRTGGDGYYDILSIQDIWRVDEADKGGM